MSGIYVRKVQRIGGQVVINIPRAICKQLGIEKGDLVAYTEVGEDSAVMTKAKFDRITQLRRQEMLDYGSGKGGSKQDGGAGENGVDKSERVGVGSGRGNKGAEGGDGGQDELRAESSSIKRGADEGRSEKVAGAEGGDNGSDDNTGDSDATRKRTGPEVIEPMETHLGRVTKKK